MMLLPGMSSTRMPTSSRLFLSFGISLTLGPLLLGTAVPPQAVGLSLESLRLLVSECLAGFALGIVARCLFAAVHMAGSLIAQISGFGHSFSSDDGHGELTSELGALLSCCVVALLFKLDLHFYVIEALVDSYSMFPFGQTIAVPMHLDRLLRAVSDAFQLVIRISAPFIMATILINLAFGMVNRIAPQIPVFFLSNAFLVATMLWLVDSLLPEMIRSSAFAIISAVPTLIAAGMTQLKRLERLAETNRKLRQLDMIELEHCKARQAAAENARMYVLEDTTGGTGQAQAYVAAITNAHARTARNLDATRQLVRNQTNLVLDRSAVVELISQRVALELLARLPSRRPSFSSQSSTVCPPRPKTAPRKIEPISSHVIQFSPFSVRASNPPGNRSTTRANLMATANRLSHMDADKPFMPTARAASGPHASTMKEIEQRFTAALLDAALPKAKAIVGKGLSGSIAREHMVNSVGRIIAEYGAFGIHRTPVKMAESHPSNSLHFPTQGNR